MNILNQFHPGKRLANSAAIRLGIVGLPLVTLLTAAAARTAQERQDRNAETSRVVALETLWNQAEVDKDIRAQGQIVPETFIYVDIEGKLSSKKEFLDEVKNSAEIPSEIGNESMVARAYANTVVVTGMYREKGTSDGKQYARRGRFTDTWVKVEGGWQCVASQPTLIGKYEGMFSSAGGRGLR